MKIGIDIDDTISKTTEKVYEYARKFNKEKYNSNYENPNELKMINRFNWTNEQNDVFFETYLKEMLEQVDVINHAREIINKLYNEGNEIIIVTARNYDYKDPYELSALWLQEKDIKYNKLYVDIIDKWEICVNEGIDIFIDDNIRNCEALVNHNIKTIRYADDEKEAYGVKKCSSWIGIYEYIKGLNK